VTSFEVYTRSLSGELSPFPELAATWKTTLDPVDGAIHSMDHEIESLEEFVSPCGV